MESKNEKKKILNQGYFFDLMKKLTEKGIITKKNVEEVNVLKGNPNVGTVDFIRQAHAVPGMDVNFAKGISLYQLEILKVLEQKKYKAVFVEGEDFEDGKPIVLSDDNQKEIKDSFFNYDASNPSEKQLELLSIFDASSIYRVLNEQAAIYGTENLLLNFKSGLLARHNSTTSHRNRYLSFAREKYAAKKVRKYLDEHPGEEVALIFGARHNFRFDFMRDLPLEGFMLRQPGQRKKEDLPVLNEIYFPQKAELVSILSKHKSLLSPLLLNSLLSSYFGLNRLFKERQRFHLRQGKRRAREKLRVHKIVENFERIDRGEDFDPVVL